MIIINETKQSESSHNTIFSKMIKYLELAYKRNWLLLWTGICTRGRVNKNMFEIAIEIPY